MARNETTPAWMWVLAHHDQIRRICDQMCSSWPSLDAEDFHHSVLIRLVDRWAGVEPDRQIMAWVRWQARAARSEHGKALARRKREVEAAHVSNWDPRCTTDAGRAIEATTMVRQVHAIATPEEWAAAVAKADGLGGSELAAVLGCAPFSATRRVRRLANRIA